MVRECCVSAPGKVMVSGEYAVLFGAPAVVTAIDRRALVYRSDGSARGSGVLLDRSAPSQVRAPEAVLALKLAEERYFAAHGTHLTEPRQPWMLDVSAQQRSGKKLGIGSSAAGAVAAIAAVCVDAGNSLDDAETRAEIATLAMEAHRAVAPHGSGADVMASAFGGVRRIQDGGSEASSVPPGLMLSVIWSGGSARTSGFIERLRSKSAGRDAATEAALRALGAGSRDFDDAWHAGRIGDIIDLAERYASSMAALGGALGLEIETPSLKVVSELARSHRGSAKPSGAGGGDIAVGFFRSASDRAAFERAVAERGFAVLNDTLGCDGVRCEVVSVTVV